jgi:hypothetical protein
LKITDLIDHLKSGGLVARLGFGPLGLYTPMGSSTLDAPTFYQLVYGKKVPHSISADSVIAENWFKSTSTGSIIAEPDVKGSPASYAPPTNKSIGQQQESAPDGGRVYTHAEISVKYRKLRDRFNEHESLDETEAHNK